MASVTITKVDPEKSCQQIYINTNMLITGSLIAPQINVTAFLITQM